jgi:hypothetical protein
MLRKEASEGRSHGNRLAPGVEHPSGGDDVSIRPRRHETPAEADNASLTIGTLDDDGDPLRRGDVEVLADIVEAILGGEDGRDLARRSLGEAPAHAR